MLVSCQAVFTQTLLLASLAEKYHGAGRQAVAPGQVAFKTLPCQTCRINPSLISLARERHRPRVIPIATQLANMQMAMSAGLCQLVQPLPQAPTARFTPCRLCNAHRVHSQRQLISLRSFTTQQACRDSRLRNVVQAAMHGDDWSTAPESYLTLVLVSALSWVLVPSTSFQVLCAISGSGTLLRENRRGEAEGQICD